MKKEEIKYIEHTDKKWFWACLENEEQVNQVCEYLKSNNLKIKTISTSFNCGGNYHVILEGIDLSGNGCCFSGENLLNHVKYYRKIKSISETDEFKEWNSKYEKFKVVRSVAVENDQRWINYNVLD